MIGTGLSPLKYFSYFIKYSGRGCHVIVVFGYSLVSDRDKRRGFNVYSFQDLVGIRGKNKYGEYTQGITDRPYFDLSVPERVRIFQKSTPVFGVVTSRMNKISGIEFDIIPDKKNEDKIVDEIRFKKMIVDEYAGQMDVKYITARMQLIMELQQIFPELLPDLSNFEGSLLRWKKRLNYLTVDRGNEIKEWLMQPNNTNNWEEFSKLWVHDLMVHGAGVLYKEEVSGKIDNIYILPGGSVIPLKSRFVGGAQAFVQIIQTYQAQIFFGDEMVYTKYIPTTFRAYPMIPLEALINKVTESLLFDKLMADQADGTKPPEKVVVFGDKSPFGDFDQATDVPVDKREQRRIETKLNEQKDRAVTTLTGIGTPLILDLTKENTMGVQMERQKQIQKDVALVFNMSNMEINETGSDGTSGRATSDSQERIEFGKGIYPIMLIQENAMNQQILPFRFGGRYRFEYKKGQNELAQLRKEQMEIQMGKKSINEIRSESNLNPFPDKQFDVPTIARQAMPDGSEQSPFITKPPEETI